MTLLCCWSPLHGCSATCLTVMFNVYLHPIGIPRADFPFFVTSYHCYWSAAVNSFPWSCARTNWVLLPLSPQLLRRGICMRRYLLGSRIWSKYFCNGCLCTSLRKDLVWLQAISPTVFSSVLQWISSCTMKVTVILRSLLRRTFRTTLELTF